MSDLHNALVKQIKTSRVDGQQIEPDDSASTSASTNARTVRDSTAFRRHSFSRLVSLKKRLNRTQERAEFTLPVPTRDANSWDSRSATDGTDLASSQGWDEAQKDNQDSDVVLSGWLYKTSRTKWTDGMTRTPHEHRQHRRFKLTEHSLEYNHLLQRVWSSYTVSLYVVLAT